MKLNSSLLHKQLLRIKILKNIMKLLIKLNLIKIKNNFFYIMEQHLKIIN